MKKFILFVLPLCAVSLFAMDVSGQGVAGTAARGTGKAAVIVVGSAAKGGWVTTKIVTKHIVAPVAKAVLLKAAPKITVFALKTAGTIAHKAVPAAAKLGVKYLSTRLPV